jgi:hypothetical protein
MSAGLGFGGTGFVDMPGFVDDQGGQDHALQMNATGSASVGSPSTDAVLRLAWLIIILSLVGLWVLGRVFK